MAPEFSNTEAAVIETPIPDGFKRIRPLVGVGGREGALVQGGPDGALSVLTFIPAPRGSSEERLIWQAFEHALQLDHPNISPPTDLRRVDGGLLLTSPWLDGPSARMIIDIAIPMRPAIAAKMMYIVPMSLWLVEHNQRVSPVG